MRASRPSTSAELTYVTSTPAIAGPAIVAARLSELTRVSRRAAARLAAARPAGCTCPRCPTRGAATSPRATHCSSGVSSPASQASGTAPRNTARTTLSASSSRLAGPRRRRRPNTSAPTTPGNVYAATAPPIHSPRSPAARARWRATPPRRSSSRPRGTRPRSRGSVAGTPGWRAPAGRRRGRRVEAPRAPREDAPEIDLVSAVSQIC